MSRVVRTLNVTCTTEKHTKTNVQNTENHTKQMS